MLPIVKMGLHKNDKNHPAYNFSASPVLPEVPSRCKDDPSRDRLPEQWLRYTGCLPQYPNMMNPVSDVATAKAINKFVDMLEDLEDVQDVYTNMETTDEVDAALEAEG